MAFKRVIIRRVGPLSWLLDVMKAFCIFSSIFVLSSCMLASPINPESIKSDSFIGCYQSSHALQYDNVQLNLKSDGTYSSTMHGHIGDWGSSAGKWQLVENRVVFTELSGTDQMKGYYSSLIIGRRWPYKVLARSSEEIRTGQTQGWSTFYLYRCDV